jgi:hypothetical protein
MILLQTPKDALEVMTFVEKEMNILCQVTPVDDKFRVHRLIKKKPNKVIEKN